MTEQPSHTTATRCPARYPIEYYRGDHLATTHVPCEYWAAHPGPHATHLPSGQQQTWWDEPSTNHG